MKTYLHWMSAVLAAILFISALFFMFPSLNDSVSDTATIETVAVCEQGADMTKEEGCLYRDGDGAIYGKFVFEGEEGPHMNIRAINNKGESTSLKTAFGYNGIVKESDDHIVMRAFNSENARGADMDQIIIITLKASPPQVKVIIPTAGYAQKDKNSYTDWYYIPTNEREPIEAEKWELQHIFYDGTLMDTWYFGKELVKKSSWKPQYRIRSLEMLGYSRALLTTYGCSDNINDVCQQYILDYANKKVKTVE